MNQMKIRSLNIMVVKLPFRFTFKHSLAKRAYSENLIVKAVLETDLGQQIVGYGESIPRDYVTGETIEQAQERMNTTYIPTLLEIKFDSASDLLSILKKQFSSFGLERDPGGASWCALELALLDAACKAESISVLKLMNPEKINDGDAGDCASIKYGAVVPFANKKALLGLLTFYKLYGFSTVKLKVGGSINEDIENVKLARQIMGEKAILRVDANCAWSTAETLDFAQKAEPYNIASIEQPVRPDDLAAIRVLSTSIKPAIVLDESLCTIEQARYLIKEKIKVDFNIRISKVGGLIAAQKICTMAQATGIKCHLGAQVGESGILTAAGRIFAVAQGPFVNYEGAANTFLLNEDLTKENLTFGFGGTGKLLRDRLSSNIKPGLGITVDEGKLNKNIRRV